MKIILIMVLSASVLFGGCVQFAPVRFETDSADIANDLDIIRKEVALYAAAASKAVTDDDDKKILDDAHKSIDDDLSKLHKRATDHYKDIKSYRDK